MKSLTIFLSKFNTAAAILALSLALQVSQVEAARRQENEPFQELKGLDIDRFMKKKNVCALLVYKNQRLRFERYYLDQDGNSPCRLGAMRCPKDVPPAEQDPVAPYRMREYGLASMTKSINSTLLGLLVAQSKAPSSETPLVEIFPELKNGGYRNRTIRDVLMMQGGLGFQYEQLKQLGDVGRYFIYGKGGCVKFQDYVQRVAEWAGNGAKHPHYQYSAFDSLMVGLVGSKYFKKNTDYKSLPDAYKALLWEPLKMEGSIAWKGEDSWKGRKCSDDVQWHWNTVKDTNGATLRPPQGMVATDCCMYAWPRDMGIFGNYILRNFQAEQNSEETPLHDWLHESMRHATPTSVLPNCYFPVVYKDYGYQWWYLGDANRDYDQMGFAAIGRGGQFIRILPKYDAVIVQFSNRTNKLDKVQCGSFRMHHKILRKLIALDEKQRD